MLLAKTLFMEQKTTPAYQGKIFPPYSEKINLLKDNRLSSKAGKIFYAILGAAFIGGIVWFAVAIFFWKWSFYIGGAVMGLLLIGAIRSMLKSQSAECPYCGHEVGAKSLVDLSADDKLKQIACERCLEWLISDQGQIRAFRESDVGSKNASGISVTEEFDCPVFANGVWPNECIVCGAEASQYLNARTFGVGLASLLIGRLSVSYGSVKKIPYCAIHKDAVSVKNSDNKIWAVFNDYGARRRYLHVNRLHFAEKK